MTASKVTATGRDRHITDPWAVLILLVLVSLLLGGCGDDQSQVQTEPDGTTQARTEPVLAAQIQYDLVGTRWVVVDMAGFPDDNVVDGRFSFGNDWFGYHDGVNDAKSEIRWNESGFTVTVTGASTDNLGPPGEERYLNTLVETGAHVEVVQRADGSLTLAQGELMVTAEPFQKENDLVDTEWAVVEMAGFPNNNAADATFQFGSEWFGFYDGVNWGSHQIIWNESGFTGGAPGDMTDMGPPPGDERYLNTLVETGAHVEVVRRADGSLTLTRGELTVTAVQTDPAAGTGAPDDNTSTSTGEEEPGTVDLEVEAEQEEPDGEEADNVGLELEAEYYALDYGVTEEEALRRLRRIDELKAIFQEIVAAETGRVASWKLVHEPEFGGLVYLVGDVEPTRVTSDLLAQHSDLFVETGATR